MGNHRASLALSSELSALTFTYGLSAEDSMPYLKLPAGKELRGDGDDLELVVAAPLPVGFVDNATCCR